MYIPSKAVGSSDINMIVEPNNTGTPTDDMDLHRESARDLANYHWAHQRLQKPVLVPVFPKPKTQPEVVEQGGWAYMHALCRQTLKITEEKYKRIDLQLINMIEHAQNVLKDRDIKVEEEVL